MAYLYLNFKCPHCEYLNQHTSETGNASVTLSLNTGEEYPQEHREPVRFVCGSCSKISAWQLDLKLL